MITHQSNNVSTSNNSATLRNCDAPSSKREMQLNLDEFRQSQSRFALGRDSSLRELKYAGKAHVDEQVSDSIKRYRMQLKVAEEMKGARASQNRFSIPGHLIPKQHLPGRSNLIARPMYH